MSAVISDTLARIVDFLALGGPVVTVLLAVSVIAATLVILKAWQFVASGVGRHRTAERALAHWLAGGHRIALDDLAASRSGASRLIWQAMATVLNAAPDDKEAVSERLRVEASAYLARLRSSFRALDAIAQVSPLIGLFGTVIGMIQAFQKLQEAGNSVDPSLLAGGIWVALLTTAVGLAVAMPTSLFLTWFESRVARESAMLERALTIVLNPAPLARSGQALPQSAVSPASQFASHAA
ncbi:MotA/TolQ/ExbB proton channel family protein [Oricola sp.]|uniref:MotA/TolQ/ExbB proton channel family protein n=1 Tax=Oricola sp. TaxID=1979950 RepID=UPI0025E1A94E|nr:MotA/TolQ/ExbB proton channel family protein [Oricola sp.]MCI5076939.1 MotA/TolQ/ExbB proton channel family protein [Oricola sp.]